MGNGSNGEFIGELAITPAGDGVHWQLIREFGFVDKRSVRWMVPEKTRVDGASIPKALWSIVGSPFTGKYVQASVIHDYYCDVRVRDWHDVHRIFYEAMLVSGVSERRAKIMYAAVYFAGPRWSGTVIYNNNLDRLFSVDASRFTKGLTKAVNADGITVRDYVEDTGNMSKTPTTLELDLDEFEHLVTQFNPSLREIAEALDATISVAQERPVGREIRGTGSLAN